MSSAPKEQLRPTLKMFSSCCTDARKASRVCPESVRPLASVMVTLSITGISLPVATLTLLAAARAALALRVSNMVSISQMSTPLSLNTVICSVYASHSSSKVRAL